VLHYTGYIQDRGGIVAILRALHAEGRFRSIHGVSRGFQPAAGSTLPVLEFPALEGEQLGLSTFWKAQEVASAVSAWLAAGPNRIFHGHSRAGLAVGLALARRGERRALVSVHCYGSKRWFYRWSARRLGGRLYWLSPSMRAYYGCPGTSWEHCVPGCVPGPSESHPEKTAPKPGSLRLGGVGALVPWKRWDLVLDAMAAVEEKLRRNIHFSHIGADDGSNLSRDYAQQLLKKTGDLGLSSNVTWHGQQPSSGNLLKDIDCLVISSEREPFSIAMLEALAAGVPVLAADDGGARDVIDPDRNGWLFQTGSHRALAQRISLLAGSDLLSKVNITAADVLPFRSQAVSATWLSIYRDLLAAQ
jgi:glycosyltransferase involved in cell wall biosynthesis